MALLAISMGGVRAVEPKDAPAILTVRSDGHILFRGRAVPLKSLDATVREAGIPPRVLILRSDGEIPYSLLVRVLDALSMRHSSIIDSPGPGYREQVERSLR
jgi:biopolymer transport protein ExbD